VFWVDIELIEPLALQDENSDDQVSDCKPDLAAGKNDPREPCPNLSSLCTDAGMAGTDAVVDPSQTAATALASLERARRISVAPS
jgi:hypothetical protein